MKYFSGQEPGTILKQKTCPTKGVLGQKEIVFRNLFHHPNLRQKRGGKSSLYSKESAFVTQQHWLRQRSGARGDAGVRKESLAQAEQQQMLTQLL